MATNKQSGPTVIDLSSEMVAHFVNARRELAAGFELASKVYDAASGDAAPRDERVERLGYALAEDAQSFRATYQRDNDSDATMDELIGAAQDIHDLAKLACTPRETVAS